MAKTRLQHCRYCDTDVENLLKHQWSEHRQEMLAFSQDNSNKHKAKAEQLRAEGKTKDPSETTSGRVPDAETSQTEERDGNPGPGGDKQTKAAGKTQPVSSGTKVTRTAKSPETKPPTLATIVAPSPGAVVFKLGSLEIPIDPKDLFECYTLYIDMRRVGITDSFSTVMNDAFGLAWKMVVPEAPSMDNMEVLNGTGTGHAEQALEAAAAGERVAS